MRQKTHLWLLVHTLPTESEDLHLAGREGNIFVAGHCLYWLVFSHKRGNLGSTRNVDSWRSVAEGWGIDGIKSLERKREQEKVRFICLLWKAKVTFDLW